MNKKVDLMRFIYYLLSFIYYLLIILQKQR